MREMERMWFGWVMRNLAGVRIGSRIEDVFTLLEDDLWL